MGDVAGRLVLGDHLVHPVIGLGPVPDHDRPLGHVVDDRLHRLDRMDRRRRALQPILQGLHPLAPRPPDGLAPGLEVAPRPLADDGVGGVQEGERVGDDRHVRVPQPPDLAGIDLHVDQRRLGWRQTPAAAQGEQAEPYAQSQHHVGPRPLGRQVVHLVVGAAVGAVAGGQEPVRREVREHRDAGGLYEALQLVGHAGLEGADAGHDHGAFRSCEGVQRSLEGRRRWTGPARKQDGLRDPHGVLVHLTV